MDHRSHIPLMLLMWDKPWPATRGAELRNLGLLQELGKYFAVELILLEFAQLSSEQFAMLQTHTRSITRVPVRNRGIQDRLRALLQMLRAGVPYHSAVLEVSFRDHPQILARMRNFPGIVYASFGHWGTFIRNQPAGNWIIDQHNADIDFWRIYAQQTKPGPLKAVAWLNWFLADRFFRRVYRRVGGIVSVCEADKQLTQQVAPWLPVGVIENGIDCAEYQPERQGRSGPPRLLFTGTSALRNMVALHQFVDDVFPAVRRQLPNAELLVGGNFSASAQAEFKQHPQIRFTGRVDDMRPLFNQSDIYIAPFRESYGSKLKIAEAMAMAIPIVATPEGVRGFPLRDGESVLIAHDPAQFAAHIIDLAHNPERRECIGAAGREVALRSIDWPVLGRRLCGIVEATWEQHTDPKAEPRVLQTSWK